jgi:O-antigen/teichoic acid export membrane protein
LFPYYTKILSITQIGELDLITSIFTLGSLLGSLQVESALARFYYERRGVNFTKFLSSSFQIILIASVTVLIFFASLSWYIVAYLGLSENGVTTIILASTNVLFYCLYTYFTSLLRFEDKPLAFFAFYIGQVLLIIIFTVCLLSMYQNISMIWLGLLLSNFSCVVILIYRYRKSLSFKIEQQTLKEILKFTLPSTPGAIIGWCNTYLNRFVLLRYLTVVDLGLFSAINKISSLILLSDMVIRMVWQPFFWRTLQEDRSTQIITNSFKKLLSWAVVGFLIFNLFDDILFKLLIDPKFWAIIPLMGILNLAYFCNIFINIVGMGPDIVKKTYLSSVTVFISIFINTASLLLLLPLIGIKAIPFSLLISNFFFIILTWTISENLFAIGYPIRIFMGYTGLSILFVFLEYFLDVPFFIKTIFVVFSCLFLMKDFISFKNLKIR